MNIPAALAAMDIESDDQSAKHALQVITNKFDSRSPTLDVSYLELARAMGCSHWTAKRAIDRCAAKRWFAVEKLGGGNAIRVSKLLEGVSKLLAGGEQIREPSVLEKDLKKHAHAGTYAGTRHATPAVENEKEILNNLGPGIAPDWESHEDLPPTLAGDFAKLRAQLGRPKAQNESEEINAES